MQTVAASARKTAVALSARVAVSSSQRMRVATPLHRASKFDSLAQFKRYSTSGRLSNTECQVVVVTSGKGGVGKTTTAANIAYGLAERGYKTVVIDFDIGLRNLDLHLGMERRVIFDIINVIRKEASLHQALIKDKRNEKLFLLAASQTRDKTALTLEGVEEVIEELKKSFDFVLCDSPAGIESGAHHAMYFSDRAIICTNPEISSCRDSDKMLGIIASKAKRSVQGREPVKPQLLITRYQPERVAAGNMLSMTDITELLGIPLIGVIPDSPDILRCTNEGKPCIIEKESEVAQAYTDSVARFLGEDRPMRFVTPKKKGFFEKLADLAKS